MKLHKLPPRKQAAIYWQRKTTPDRFGKFSFEEPVEIKCRWEDRPEEFLDSKGEAQLSSSIVYPDRAMKVGDQLKLGELESDTGEDPVKEQAKQIASFESIPDFRARRVVYVAHL